MSRLLSLDYDHIRSHQPKRKVSCNSALPEIGSKSPAEYSLPALTSALLRNYVDVSLADCSGSRRPVLANDAALTSLRGNND